MFITVIEKNINIIANCIQASQKKWHVKPTTEQNPKNIILHCGTNDVNDDSGPQKQLKKLLNWPNQHQKIVTVTLLSMVLFQDMVS